MIHNNYAAVKKFGELVDGMYYRKGQPYAWRTDEREWWQCKQNGPLSYRQLTRHLLGDGLVFGARGLFRSEFSVIDFDHCLFDDSLFDDSPPLTYDARQRHGDVLKAVDGFGVSLRSSNSGGIHHYLKHNPIWAPVRDVCLDMQLAETGSEYRRSSGVIEAHPTSNGNLRLPLGSESFLLDMEELREGIQVESALSKYEQVAALVDQPLYQWPTLHDALAQIRAEERGQAASTEPSGVTLATLPGAATEFNLRAAHLLEYGPGPGEHHDGLLTLALYFKIHGYSIDRVKDALWEWQCTKATHCNEWQERSGPDKCREHIRRVAEYTEREFIPHAAGVIAIEQAGVSVTDALLGLELFGGGDRCDVTLLRAFCELCRHVRPRFKRYPDNVMPIHSHLRWRTWTGRYRELQDRLKRAGICTAVQEAIRGVQSTRFKIELAPTDGPTFDTWGKAVWEACGRDRAALGQHFSKMQLRTHFGWLDGPTMVIGTL